jgi:hypothetical protein
MLFQQRTDVILPPTTVALGGTLKLELTREFFLEGLLIHVIATSPASAPTLVTANEGLASIFSNVRLTVPTGSNTRTVVNSTSSALLQYHRQWNGGVDSFTTNFADVIAGQAEAANQVRYFTVPVWFAPPNLDDPVASAFLLPLPRFSANPVLELTLNSSASIYIANAPTIQIFVEAVRRFVDRPDWVTYDTELTTNEITVPSAASNNSYELPAPGAYTSMLMQTYTSGGVARRPWWSAYGSSVANIGQNPMELRFLGTSIRRQSAYGLVVLANYSAEIFNGTNYTAGQFGDHNVFWDFLSDKVGSSAADFNSVVDTTPLIGQGARINLLYPAANSGDKIRLTTHRVFGDLTALKRK